MTIVLFLNISPPTALFNLIKTLSFTVIFVSFEPPIPNINSRFTNRFPICPFLPASCHWPSPSDCVSSTCSVRPRHVFSLTPLIAGLPNILNVTFLMFLHVSCPPPTISPLFCCESISRVRLHNGWDRLTVQLMIIRTHNARGAALIRVSKTDCLHEGIEYFSENWL